MKEVKRILTSSCRYCGIYLQKYFGRLSESLRYVEVVNLFWWQELNRNSMNHARAVRRKVAKKTLVDNENQSFFKTFDVDSDK